MPDRAVVPLVCGGSAGFLCGLMASVLEMSGGPLVILMLAAGAFGALAGAASVVRAPGADADRRPVAAIRAALTFGYVCCIYLGMVTFLRDGHLIVAVLLMLLGGLLAYCLTQVRVREPKEMSQGTGVQA
jgi:hypothetical protein